MSPTTKVLLGASMVLLLAPFVWSWLTVERADLLLTILLVLGSILVVFEVVFKVLQDFGGAPRD